MPTGENQSPIDFAHLKRYTLGDRALEREVLSLFATQLHRTLADLREAASDRDWRMATHALKGSSRAVGAWHLANAAEAAERHPGVPQRIELGHAMAPVERAADEALAFIASLD